MPDVAIVLTGLLIVSLLVALAALVSARRARRLAYDRLLEEHRALEEDLAQLQRRSVLDGAALDLVRDAVIYLHGDRRISYLNKTAGQFVGVGRGQPLIEAIRDYDLENLLRRTISQGEEQSAVIALSRPKRVVRAVVRPIAGTGIVIALNDRTEVVYLHQVRRDLVANVSHELRTPLATLQLLVETLLEGAADDPEVRDTFLRQLHDHASQLADIVQQSLHLASLESGEMSMNVQPVSVQALVEQSAAQLAAQAARRSAQLQVDLAPGLPNVNADFEQIESVLTNLLDNAIKWTPQGGRIFVRAVRDGDWVRFEVRDTGPGVASGILPRLFERFYKGDEARSGSGTGLGLSIAKHTVQLHGGRIWAESTPGAGACFLFTLPVADSNGSTPGCLEPHAG